MCRYGCKVSVLYYVCVCVCVCMCGYTYACACVCLIIVVGFLLSCFATNKCNV